MIRKIDERIKMAYAEWEAGEAASPSAQDLVRYGAEILGFQLSEDRIDSIAFAVFDIQCDGADTDEVAELIYDRLMSV
jgi:hypothetical protein